ncbi:hypothetical protein [Gordonia bronchialis]|uniref:hypothetical protein n=1 Tax=Gordonia bronchialis TaxID=2054 RepID=UPI002D1E4131|nr:hypothetical protein [Gordonia bronchialis]
MQSISARAGRGPSAVVDTTMARCSVSDSATITERPRSRGISVRKMRRSPSSRAPEIPAVSMSA